MLKTVRSVLEKDTIRPPVVRKTSLIDEGHHSENRNKADHDAAFASAAPSTTDAEQHFRNLASRKESHEDFEGESRAVVNTSRNLISKTSTDTRGARYGEYSNSSGTNGKKPGLMGRLNPGKDAVGDRKAGNSASRTSDQSVRGSLHQLLLLR